MRSDQGHNITDDGQVERSNRRQDWLETAHRGRHLKSYDLMGRHIITSQNHTSKCNLYPGLTYHK